MTLTRRFRPSAPRGRHAPSTLRLTTAVLTALLLTATGCGSSDGSDASNSSASATTSSDSSSATGGQQPSAWADDVCSAASDWKAAVDTAQATLSDKADLSANGVRDAVDSVATATDSLVTSLKGLGTPDTAAGDQARAELSTLATQLQQQKTTITGATSPSPTTARQLLTQVSTITGALAAMLTGITATVDAISQLDGAEELKGAFQTAPSCQQLSATPSTSS